MTRSTAAGFTLIEALIALALLAITAVSFLQATTANITRVEALETRAAASWVAQNRLAEVSLGLTAPEAPVQMLGHRFDVVVTASPTPDPGLIQIDIAANDSASGAGAGITGFVLARGAR